jgi:hypothetical protein
MGSNIYVFLTAFIKRKRKEYHSEGGENCVMKRSMICAVTKCYHGDKSEDDKMGGL